MDSSAIVLPQTTAQKIGGLARGRLVDMGCVIIAVAMLVGVVAGYCNLPDTGYTVFGVSYAIADWLSTPIQRVGLLTAVGVGLLLQLATTMLFSLPGLQGQEPARTGFRATLAISVCILEVLVLLEILRALAATGGVKDVYGVVMFLGFASTMGVAIAVDCWAWAYYGTVRAATWTATVNIVVAGGILASVGNPVMWLVPVSAMVCLVLSIGGMRVEGAVRDARDRVAQLMQKGKCFESRSVVYLTHAKDYSYVSPEGVVVRQGTYLDILKLDTTAEALCAQTQKKEFLTIPESQWGWLYLAEPGYHAEGAKGEEQVGLVMQFRVDLDDYGISKGQLCEVLAYDETRECYQIRPRGDFPVFTVHWTFLRGYLEYGPGETSA